MSRIYEALQKAEAERQQQETRSSLLEPQPADRAADPALDPPAGYAQQEFASAYAAAAPIAASAAFAEPASFAAPVTAPAGAFSFESIATHDWSPSLEKLPSLLDRGPSVEQFRSLRSRLYELRGIRPLKTVLVSSGMPQEGKSFVSANLAISLARHRNSRVLLIDGDMRRYTIHQMLGASSGPGLADFLAGTATLPQVLQRAAIPAAPSGSDDSNRAILANLAFIPGGNGGDKAADLSGSPRFTDLIKAVAPLFDWIIVDSSPVLPVSDAVNLARSTDGVLLVARGGQTKYPVAQKAAAEMRSANILGFVLNAVHEAPQAGSYYGYGNSKE